MKQGFLNFKSLRAVILEGLHLDHAFTLVHNLHGGRPKEKGLKITFVSTPFVGKGKDVLASKLGELLFWLSVHFRTPKIIKLIDLPAH
jgi:hypothetical protein